MEEYQTRLDIDRLYDMVWDSDANQLKLTTIDDFLDLVSKLGFNQSNSDKFNFAIINKTNGNIEYWIMSNAYYDYDKKRFIKIDEKYTSHAIQIQAKGTYAGEEEIDANNTSIGVWRNPPSSEVYMDTTTYDYSEFLSNKVIGAKLISPEQWVEFGISAGWSNTLMLDAYGGMTIGGAGFEVDGNGIFPYTRLTSSSYIANNQQFYLLGLLDNAYHPTTGGWKCDNNNDWAWFVGLKFPHKSETHMHKDTQNASFVIMYNDMASADKSKEHNLNPSDWHIVFEVDKTGAKGGGGGGGSSDVYPSDNTPLSDVSGGGAGLSNDYSRADHRHPLLNAYPPETHDHDDKYYDKTYISSNMATKSELPTPTKRYPLEDVAGGNAGEIEDEYALADHQHDLSDAYATSEHDHDTKYYTKPLANDTFATKQELPKPTNLSPPKDAGNGNKGVSVDYARADHVHPRSDIYAPKWSFDELHTTVQDLSSELDKLNVGYYKYNSMPDYDSGQDNALYIDYNDSTHSLDFYNWEEDSSSGTLRHILVKLTSIPPNLLEYVATSSNNGLMSSTDKSTFDAIPSTYATKTEVPKASTSRPSTDSRDGNIGSSSNYAKADHSHPMATDIYAPRWSFDELYTLVHAINSQLDRLNVGYYKYNSMPEYDSGEDNALYIDYNDSSHSLDFYNWEEDSSSGTLRHILVKIASLPLQQYDQWERITGTDFLGDGKLYVNKAIRMAEFTWTYTNSSTRAVGDEQGYRLSNVPSQYCPVASFITGIAHNGGATIRVDSSGVITIRFLKAYNTTSRDFHFSLQWHY